MRNTTLALVTSLGLLAAASTTHAQVANTPDIARALAAMGNELSRELVGGTMALYGPLHAADTAGGFTLQADKAYGDDERQRLDLYLPEPMTDPAPLLVFVHGGGFVRGDKADVAHIGRYLARAGIAVATMNYRLAPAHTWPSGARDVAAALNWLGASATEIGYDGARIVLAGNSAGAMHVADYVFREALQNPDDGVVGAILLSPPTVDLEARDIDPQRDALYYGVDGDRAAQSVVNALDGREIPLLVGFAEYEPAIIHDQTRRLVEALARRDGHLPLMTSAPGHNHISIVEHIGTADETLGPDLVELVRRVASMP